MKKIQCILAAGLFAWMCTGVPAGAMAAEDAKMLQLSVGTQKIEVSNESGMEIDTFDYEKKSQEETGSILAKEKAGTEHLFEVAEEGSWTEAVLYEEYGFLYLKYLDEAGKIQELAEQGKEKELEEPVTVYAVNNVNVRKGPNTDEEALMVTTVADEGTVTAVAPGWLKIKIRDVEGYASHRYFTENKEEAQAELEKRRAEEAAWAAAQSKASSGSSSGGKKSSSGGKSSQKVHEVGRQKYDDCDGSGHGYYEITYSDGSVAYEEY